MDSLATHAGVEEIKIEEQTTADQGNQLSELKQAFEDERRAKEADDLVLIKWKMDWRIWIDNVFNAEQSKEETKDNAD